MKPEDLQFQNFSSNHLRYYDNRAGDFSGKFLRWFLEHIFRLDPLEADDAAVDAKHDKGIDAIYVDDVSEIVYLIQAKTKTSDKATLGDVDLKSFVGALAQFDSAESIGDLISETKNERLKQALTRNAVQPKVEAGYSIKPVFITNVPSNSDADTYLKKKDGIVLYDADVIATEYVDLEVNGGIQADFYFDVSDTDVIEYDAGGAAARIFLAPALNLLKMKGISDGSLFEQNVRLSLGNTKVNRGLRESIRRKNEHSNFPLYHNGINVLCEEITKETDQKISIRDYVVVNGAQSLTSLLAEKSKISDDLKVLVKLIEVKGDIVLSQAITRNSNNQNAIKARDLKSNHNIQQRLKVEIEECSHGTSAYEIKQGENNKGKRVISNEMAGLVILAMDLEQPWNCHQKYKVMDDLHSDIFGRPSVTGGRVLAFWESFQALGAALEELDNELFGQYTLTRYFLAYAVVSIIRADELGAEVLANLDTIAANGKLNNFVAGFENLAVAAANDLNAEISDDEDDHFDYKNDLKSSKWCRQTAARLLAQYKKDVRRKKADPIAEMFDGLL
ncbi:AIPR family protein [Novosphingobium panipatense]|uniref:AIPR protein n=2 Tax=Novosphingobium panipatense TaxID=428991 RepID=A0ABY1PX18_9SPHN|nr:AIPR family protein [Novosphingobium panipatense]SMP51536.1 AIPR protein [Novosphingobium panipatense]